MICILDSARGQYIPQNFAEVYGDNVPGIDPIDIEILRSGPSEEFYWEAWDSVLDIGRFDDGTCFWQGECGDVFEGTADEANEYWEAL